MKMFRRMMTVGLVVAACSTAARGQVAVVSAKSADGLISGVRSVVVATDLGEPAQPILGMLDSLKAPGMLKGIDLARPLGAYADIPSKPGELPYAVVLVPVSDRADFLALLEGHGMQAKPVEGVAGVTHSIELPNNPSTLFGRFEDGYACFASRPAGPPSAAALKPAMLLAGRAALLGATIRLDLIPAPIKKTFLGQMEATIARERDQKPGEDAPTYQGRLAGMALVMDSFSALVRDGGALNLEVAESKGDLAVDLTANALPGSKLAGAFRAFGSTSSLFRGIGARSVAETYVRTSLSAEMKKAFAVVGTQAREGLAQKEADALEKELGNEMIDLLESILNAPAVDIGAALHGPSPGAGRGPTFAGVFALKVEDGPRVDRFLRKLAAAAAKEMPPGVEKVTLDKDKAGDGSTSIHEVRLAAGNPALDRFGEPVIRLATRRDALVVALGGQALDAIRRTLDAIDRPPSGPSPQLKAEAALGKVAMALAATPKGAQDLAEMLRAQGIFQGADATRDRVGLAVSVGEALTIRLRLDAPTLKFLAMMGVGR